MPTRAEFSQFLQRRFRAAEAQGEAWLLIKAKDLHEEAGKSARNVFDHYPSCSNAMRQELTTEDQLVHEPPKGRGSGLTIRYRLPRPGSIFQKLHADASEELKSSPTTLPIQSADTISALDDIAPTSIDSRIVSLTVFVRNEAVRQAVLARANGRCEYCGAMGFLKTDGSLYLESHHIIALAKDGEDTLANVIALCPHHHREAHFGVARDDLETAMIQKVKLLTA